MSERIRKTYTSTEMIEVIALIEKAPKDFTARGLIKWLNFEGYRIVKIPK